MIKMMISNRNYLKFCKGLKSVYKRFRCSAVELETSEKPPHLPVMKDEVMEHLSLKDGDTVLDMTFGAGGHTRHILERYPNLKVIALDRDPLAHGYAKELQKELPDQITPLLGRFSELHRLAEKNKIPLESVDGVIFDLGASSMQMDFEERGFAVSNCGPLDMRMDGDRYPDSITAADVLNYAAEEDLYKIFKLYGQENHSKIIARSVIHTRTIYKKFKTTGDLADLVELLSKRPRFDKLQRKAHSATRVFQALRIFVNDEINELNQGLLLAHFMLKIGGRITVLSFHSLEDTLVKRHFQGHIFDNAPTPADSTHKSTDLDVTKDLKLYKPIIWSPINKKVVKPTEDEVNLNPRSRSAKLRAAVKTDHLCQ